MLRVEIPSNLAAALRTGETLPNKGSSLALLHSLTLIPSAFIFR